MTLYTAMLQKVEFDTRGEEPPGLLLKLTFPNPPVPKVMIGLDSLNPSKEHLAAVASALSAAAGVDNYMLIRRQLIRLEVNPKRYVTGLVFLKSGKRVDLKYLFRGCKQADDGSDVPRC